MELSLEMLGVDANRSCTDCHRKRLDEVVAHPVSRRCARRVGSVISNVRPVRPSERCFSAFALRACGGTEDGSRRCCRLWVSDADINAVVASRSTTDCSTELVRLRTTCADSLYRRRTEVEQTSCHALTGIKSSQERSCRRCEGTSN